MENRLKQHIIQLIIDEMNKEAIVSPRHFNRISPTRASTCSSSTLKAKRRKLFDYDNVNDADLSEPNTLDPVVELDAYLNDTQLSRKYSSKEILNTDQVGIEQELHSTQTLGRVPSKNATTHSYTIQPTISLDSRVIGPMFLCLQETTGRVGNIVKRHLFEPQNVVITCSSSGQYEDNIYQDLKSVGKAVHRIQIPTRTTLEIQPLDKYFNRQIKNLAKKLYDRVALDQLDVNLHERNNINKLVSLIHNQLSAPVFKNMILYSWFASGYLKRDPSPFKN
ncbi:unnamed protein product, partial [Adineta ricciae]